MRRALRIGLLWHNYPSENLGVGALSLSHLTMLDGILDELDLPASYLVAGMMPAAANRFEEATTREVDYRQFSLKALAADPAQLLQLRREFSRCDLFLDLSEGDSFADIYGMKRLLAQVASKALVLGAGRPLVLGPQTIGPFETRVGQVAARQIMRRCRRVFPRDDRSFDYVQGRGLGDRAEMMTDLAFALPYDRTGCDAPADRVNVGVNVSGLLWNGGYDGRNQFGLTIDYRRFTREILQALSLAPGTCVHLVPHVISDRYAVEDDYRVAEELVREFPACRLAPRFTSPIEAKSFIAGMDFFLGARMHATIAAFSSGVPVVPVAYSRKFIGLFGSLGYDTLVDGKADSTDAAIERILTGFAARDQLRRRVAAGNEIAQARLGTYRGYLRTTLQEMAVA